MSAERVVLLHRACFVKVRGGEEHFPFHFLPKATLAKASQRFKSKFPPPSSNFFFFFGMKKCSFEKKIVLFHACCSERDPKSLFFPPSSSSFRDLDSFPNYLRSLIRQGVEALGCAAVAWRLSVKLKRLGKWRQTQNLA